MQKWKCKFGYRRTDIILMSKLRNLSRLPNDHWAGRFTGRYQPTVVVPWPIRVLNHRSMASQLTGRLEHPEHARRAHRHRVGVEHHVREPPVSFQRVLLLELQDRVLLPASNQKSRGSCRYAGWESRPSVPVAELASGRSRAIAATARPAAGLCGPAADELDDGVTDRLGNPASRSEFPKFFF